MNNLLRSLNRTVLILTLAFLLASGIPGVIHSEAEDADVYLPVVNSAGGSNPSGGGLDNGESFVGLDGVGIGALSDTLSQPIEVSISSAPVPSIPLPGSATALSSYYNLSAGEDTFVSTESPFILAFPVPSGAATQHLALAVLIPTDGIADWEEEGVHKWEILEGLYHPGKNLFLTTIPFLSSDGRSFVLIEDPGFQSPQTGSPNRAAINSPLFEVRCSGWLSVSCASSDLEDEMEDLLRFVRGQLILKGYPEPRIKNLAGDLDFSPNLLASLGHIAYLEDRNGGLCKKLKAGGYYVPETGHLAVCPTDPANGFINYEIYTVKHEYFHSLQFAYPAVLNDRSVGKQENWIIEGMAKAAEKSYNVDEMRCSESFGWEELHEVDENLQSETDLNEYFAQDFWVFGGQMFHKGIDYFISVLSAGATVDAVKLMLPGILNPLDDTYWRWAKNQFMEKDINFNDNALGQKCKLDKPVVKEKKIWLSDDAFKEGTVPPHDSVVVEFRWTKDITQNLLTIWELKSMAPNYGLKYKVYEERESNCGGAIPDGFRLLKDVTKGKTYFVLLTNVTTDQDLDFMLVFD